MLKTQFEKELVHLCVKKYNARYKEVFKSGIISRIKAGEQEKEQQQHQEDVTKPPDWWWWVMLGFSARMQLPGITYLSGQPIRTGLYGLFTRKKTS